MRKSAEQWEGEIRGEISAGERYVRIDLSQRALQEYRANPKISYLAVLALARAGATRQARAQYDLFGLAAAASSGALGPFEIDVASLDARIAKDGALEAPLTDLSGIYSVSIVADSTPTHGPLRLMRVDRPCRQRWPQWLNHRRASNSYT